jgi:hypothetical protein
MKVEQLMTRKVKVCTESDTVNRAAQLMWESDCGCIPIIATNEWEYSRSTTWPARLSVKRRASAPRSPRPVLRKRSRRFASLARRTRWRWRDKRALCAATMAMIQGG